MPSAKSSLDLTNYVAIGDSITSGYTDAALHYDGQLYSYAYLFAQQLKSYGGGNFKQALVSPNSVGIGFFGNSRLILKKNEKQLFDLMYIAPQGDLSIFASNNYYGDGPYNNLGIPGVKAITAVFPGYGNPNNGAGNYNPFFTRVASNPLTASVLSDAIAAKPSFFSLYIGNNDVLAYALSGGTSDSITPPLGAPGKGFEGSVQTIINALVATGAKGVIANIPDITSIPFFTAIPFNGLLLDAARVSELSTRFSNCNFKVGHNAFIIEDPAGIRQMNVDELVLLDIILDPNKNDYLNGITPIPKKYMLTAIEKQKIQSAVNAYNVLLKSLAKSKGLAFVDLNSVVKALKPDRVYNEYTQTISYKTKGIFSLDGIHLNAFGQALFANKLIKAINKTYGADIVKLNVNKYKGIETPK